jgi:hypothetical protein
MNGIRQGSIGLALAGVFAMGTGFSFPTSVPKIAVPGAPAAIQGGAGALVARVPDVVDHLPPEVIDQLGVIAFNIYLGLHTVAPIDSEESQRAAHVARQLTDVAATGPRGAVARGFRWETRVIKDGCDNAVAFPGGKIVVCEGLLVSTRESDDDLAVALGHEMSHALARHVAERISADVRREIALSMTGKQLSEKGLSPAAVTGLMVAFGLAHERVVMQPFARQQESDADHEGLLLAARAGYDPQEAVAFWTQRKSRNPGGITPIIFAYHPTDDTRIRQLQGWMPEAMAARAGQGRRTNAANENVQAKR